MWLDLGGRKLLFSKKWLPICTCFSVLNPKEKWIQKWLKKTPWEWGDSGRSHVSFKKKIDRAQEENNFKSKSVRTLATGIIWTIISREWRHSVCGKWARRESTVGQSSTVRYAKEWKRPVQRVPRRGGRGGEENKGGVERDGHFVKWTPGEEEGNAMRGGGMGG